MSEGTLTVGKRTVNIQKIRGVAKKLPPEHPLKKLFEVEDSEMDAEEYVIKLKTWLRLLE